MPNSIITERQMQFQSHTNLPYFITHNKTVELVTVLMVTYSLGQSDNFVSGLYRAINHSYFLIILWLQNMTFTQNA